MATQFDIPTVNKTAKSVSTTEVNAMLNAAKQARKLINEYLKDHPELKNIVDKYWAKDWIIGTICSLLEREAENIISAESIFGKVPNSSQKNTQRFSSLPPFSSATDKISR